MSPLNLNVMRKETGVRTKTWAPTGRGSRECTQKSRKNRTPEENVRREKIRELLQLADISSMDDIQSLFKETIAEFMGNSLDAELEDDLDYSKYDYRNKDTDNKQPDRI